MLPAEPPAESGELDQDLVDEWKRRLHNAKELVCELCVSEEAIERNALDTQEATRRGRVRIGQLTRNSPDACPAMFRVVTQAGASAQANATTDEKTGEVANRPNANDFEHGRRR